ncbi:MAG TPA: NTP transferase domain-containing protein [Kofleriaceae bacterium]|nr:NTP transferase domain-containing protein [Kofleriaceae bacterium]
MSRVVAGIQARMGSSRLPGKSLALLGGLPVIGWVVTRVARAHRIDEVWVLTTESPEDDALADIVARDLPVARLLRGSAADVRDRYARMVERSGATDVVRITADCPLVDSALLDALVELHRARGTDYAHIASQSHYPFSYPHGLNAEILTRAAFARLLELGSEPRHREHVTIAVDEHPEAFRTARLAPPPALSRPRFKVCVDTPADLERVRRVVGDMGAGALDAGVAEIVAACDRVLGREGP